MEFHKILVPAALAVASILPAQQNARAAEALKLLSAVEGIEEYQLSNGLKIILFPDPSKQTITVNVTYLVGSRHENYGETGMAHLLEHLLFKGSTNHPNIPDELTSHGCRPNGSTWFDRTNYFETFDASDENLVWALDMESDRMVNSFIAAKDLVSEMTVVRNEFETGENNPREVLTDRILSTAYLWHNYGKSTIGARSDIENVPIDRLQAFYRMWYQPDNAIIIVSGKFARERALALIQEKFGRIAKPERVLPTIYTSEPAQDGERSVTLRRTGDTQVAGLAYHIPAGAHPDFAAAEVLGQILGDTPSGRLYKEIVETKKATAVSAWPMQFHDPAALLITAQVRTEASATEALRELIRVAESAGTNPPTKEELDRAKQALLKQWETSMRNTEWAAVGLSEWAAMGDWRLMFLHRDRIGQVEAADVQRVAQAYLRESNRTAGLFLPTTAPDRTEIPPTPDVASMVKDYKGGEGLAAGEEFNVEPEAIEAGIQRSELPSGLKLTLVPKKTRGETVRLNMALHLGDDASLQGKSVVSQLAGGLLMRGTANRTRQQIQDELDRMKAQISVWGRGEMAVANVEVERANLEPALRLLAEILQTPAFPASEFEQLRQEHLLELEESKTEPQEIARVALDRHLHPWPVGHIRYAATPDEDVAEVKAATLESLSAFHRDFYGASAGELSMVGDFDPAQVQELLKELFEDWRNKSPYTRIPSPHYDVQPLHTMLEAPDKEGAVFNAGLNVSLRDDDPDYPALVLGNYMTGGGFLNSRLATRLRQKDGLSYGVGSWFFASAKDPSAGFGAYAICAPQNAVKLQDAFREEIERVVEEGFTADEVTQAKSGWLQRRRVSRSNDRELAGMLNGRTFDERTLLWDAQFEKQVSDLTPEQINQAMRKHIDPARISTIAVGDFAKAKNMPATEPGQTPGAETKTDPKAEQKSEKQ